MSGRPACQYPSKPNAESRQRNGKSPAEGMHHAIAVCRREPEDGDRGPITSPLSHISLCDAFLQPLYLLVHSLPVPRADRRLERCKLPAHLCQRGHTLEHISTSYAAATPRRHHAGITQHLFYLRSRRARRSRFRPIGAGLVPGADVATSQVSCRRKKASGRRADGTHASRSGHHLTRSWHLAGTQRVRFLRWREC